MTSVANDERAAVTRMLDDARRQLLDARVEAGHWEGELSSSALSTATASFALWLCEGEERARLARGGVRWLTEHQNPDGGWGDTTRSLSNISTTVLCWAALRAIPGTGTEAVKRAEAWLTGAAGSLEPATLSHTISSRYGKDRTFSVPILTMCAAAGVFGAGAHAWRHVPQLPFELAAMPRSWFPFLGLPVVSYALPALIAIGQVRHRRRPTLNPFARLLRRLTSRRTLNVLEQIQPAGGGFLEATPLTSFVIMSLLAGGVRQNPVVSRGVEFLARSVRADGSWPIDTNLATWVTTLSVNALAADGRLREHLSQSERGTICTWLLAQQYRVVHPYTGAPPGGWAWTDLPGGVPDADDTAGALLALRNLGELTPEVDEAARAGVGWLLGIQNRDGGIPTFCRGWGKLPFDRSAPELTAHALRAWSAWRDRLPNQLASKVDGAATRAENYLRSSQSPGGSWTPLWFGNQHAPDEANPTHGTARVLQALAAAPATESTRRAVAWLLAAQNQDGGWGGAPGVASSIEETCQAVHALSVVQPLPSAAVASALSWLAKATDTGQPLEAAPIGLYFARLWYWERLYPLIGLASLASLGSRLPAQRPHEYPPGA